MAPCHGALGYFGYRKNMNAYVEVISFDKLVGAAKERNRAFFDKLGLPKGTSVEVIARSETAIGPLPDGAAARRCQFSSRVQAGPRFVPTVASDPRAPAHHR